MIYGNHEGRLSIWSTSQDRWWLLRRQETEGHDVRPEADSGKPCTGQGKVRRMLGGRFRIGNFGAMCRSSDLFASMCLSSISVRTHKARVTELRLILRALALPLPQFS